VISDWKKHAAVLPKGAGRVAGTSNAIRTGNVATTNVNGNGTDILGMEDEGTLSLSDNQHAI